MSQYSHHSLPAAEFPAMDSSQFNFRAITGCFQMKTEAGFNLLGVIKGARVLVY